MLLLAGKPGVGLEMLPVEVAGVVVHQPCNQYHDPRLSGQLHLNIEKHDHTTLLDIYVLAVLYIVLDFHQAQYYYWNRQIWTIAQALIHCNEATRTLP
jgi:hypothetical protein